MNGSYFWSMVLTINDQRKILFYINFAQSSQLTPLVEGPASSPCPPASAVCQLSTPSYYLPQPAGTGSTAVVVHTCVRFVRGFFLVPRIRIFIVYFNPISCFNPIFLFTNLTFSPFVLSTTGNLSWDFLFIFENAS